MSEETNTHTQLDRQRLQNGPITLFFRMAVLEKDLAWFRQQNYHVVTFDCLLWKSEEDFFTDMHLKLGTAARRSLDALDDDLYDACLNAIHSPQKRGVVLVFLRFDTFTTRHPQLAQIVLEIIAKNSYCLLLDSYQLIALIQSDDPTLSFEPIGAHSVSWNSYEAFYKNRGLKNTGL